MKLILVASKYLKSHPILTGCVLCSIIIASFFEGVSFGMLIPLIQSMTTKGASTKLISSLFAIMFLSLIIKNIFSYLSDVLIGKLRFSTVKELRANLMNNLLEYDIEYFDSVKTGHIISNINTETLRMGDFLLAVLQFMALSGRVFAYIVLLFLISWKVSIVIFLLITSVLIPIEVILKKIKRIGVLISEAIVDYNHKLTEILNGIRLIKGCGTEEMEKKDFDTKAERIYHVMYMGNKYMQLIIPVTEIFIFGLIILCFLMSINLIKLDIINAFPFIATYLVVLAKMLTQLNNLNSKRSNAMNQLSAFTCYEKMYNKKGKKTIKNGNKKVDAFLDSIEFKAVNFSYMTGKKVLRGINIGIPKGKITALVGASGAGKSTIVNLVMRFYDIDSGEILVDGINLKDFILKEWRKKIGIVSQDIFLFNTSVKNNISYGQDTQDEEIINAAKAAHAHEFIMNLPAKYETLLGERGVRLSGGQKQRISIARAIIHNPEILILDEATSSLDTETERLITEAIERLRCGRTVIAIAHRLSTILHADNIIVLDEGGVVEQGRHTDLLNKDGLYKKLFETQFGLYNK